MFVSVNFTPKDDRDIALFNVSVGDFRQNGPYGNFSSARLQNSELGSALLVTVSTCNLDRLFEIGEMVGARITRGNQPVSKGQIDLCKVDYVSQ